MADEWGRVGVRHLDQVGGEAALVTSELDVVAARSGFERSLLDSLATSDGPP